MARPDLRSALVRPYRAGVIRSRTPALLVLRWLVVVIGFVVLAAACTLPLTEEQAETTTTTTEPPGPSTTEPLVTTPPTLPPLDPEVFDVVSQLPGRLAVLIGPRVGIVNPDGTSGAFVGGGVDGVVTQPTWSNEGALLAWSLTRVGESSLVIHDPASGVEIATPIEGPPAFYLQWNHTDQLLSFLRNSPSGQGIEASIVRAGGDPSVADVGAPHFFDWAPDRDVWVSHVDNSRLSFVSGVDSQTLDVPLRRFSTPFWIDESSVLVGAEQGFGIVDLDATQVEYVAVPEGPLTFTLSPDGRRAAYLEPRTDDLGQPAPGVFRVLDLETRTSVTVTDDRVFNWEWSPDGTRLAWMGLDRADAANLAQWHVWSVAQEAEISSTPSYRPSDLMLTSYFPFFTQYAVSHRTWAPDSSAFVFAGSIGGDQGIWVHVVDSEVDAALVSRGSAAFWSPNEERQPDAAPAPF